jgi:hypothetical protein
VIYGGTGFIKSAPNGTRLMATISLLLPKRKAAIFDATFPAIFDAILTPFFPPFFGQPVPN